MEIVLSVWSRDASRARRHGSGRKAQQSDGRWRASGIGGRDEARGRRPRWRHARPRGWRQTRGRQGRRRRHHGQLGNTGQASLQDGRLARVVRQHRRAVIGSLARVAENRGCFQSGQRSACPGCRIRLRLAGQHKQRGQPGQAHAADRPALRRGWHCRQAIPLAFRDEKPLPLRSVGAGHVDRVCCGKLVSRTARAKPGSRTAGQRAARTAFAQASVDRAAGRMHATIRPDIARTAGGNAAAYAHCGAQQKKGCKYSTHGQCPFDPIWAVYARLVTGTGRTRNGL